MSVISSKQQKVQATSKSGLSASFVAWARSIARSDKLKVVFGGHPATDGKTMYLPQIPMELTEDDLLMVRSDIMHESGHCTDTDFEYFTEFSKKHGPLAQSLLNSIEDVRIEKTRAKKYPGAEALIHDSNILMMDRGKSRTGQAGAADALTTVCYMHGCALRGWAGRHAEARDTAVAHLKDHLGAENAPLVDQLIDLLDSRFAGLRSTQDCGQLTLDVLKIFQDAKDEMGDQQSQDSGDDDSGASGESQNQGDGSSKGDSQDDPSDDSSESSGSGEGEGEDDGSKGSDSSENADSGSEESEGQSGESGGSEGDSGSDESNEQSGQSGGSEGDSGSDDSKGQSGQSGKSDGESGQEQGSNSSGSGDQSSNDGSESGEGSQSDGQETGQSSGSGQSSSRSDKAKQALEAMLGTNPGEEEVIDYQKAVEELAEAVRKGEKYQNSPKVPEHTVDYSPEAATPQGGSGAGDMSVSGCGWAVEDRGQYQRLTQGTEAKANVLLGQLQALLRMATQESTRNTSRGRLNARKLFRTGFDDDRVFKKSSRRILPAAAATSLVDLSGSMKMGGGNLLDTALQVQALLMKAMATIGNPMEIAGFGGKKGNVLTFAKAFDEHVKAAQNRLGGMVAESGGGTPLLEAITHASFRLAEREETKKVMFIITDGEPNEPEQVREVLDALIADGVHVYTFLIGDASGGEPAYLRGLNVVSVPHIDDLSASALSVIKQSCMG